MNTIQNAALVAFGFAAILSALISYLCVRLLVKIGPIDKPVERSSHKSPIASSGGIAIMAALWFGYCAYKALSPDLFSSFFSNDAVIILCFGTVLGGIGAIDDVFDLSAKLRLGLQILLSLALAAFFPINMLEFGFGLYVTLPYILGVILAAGWVILSVNAVNFMDGANGLASGSQAIWLLFLGIFILSTGQGPGDLGVLLLLGFIAHLPFIVKNIKNCLFQGDAGAFLSATLISASLLAAHRFGLSVWIGAIILAPFYVDVLLTLATRYSQKKPLMQAHREHLYQLWLIHKNPSHFSLALRIWGIILCGCVVALISYMIQYYKGFEAGFMLFLLWLGALTTLWFKIKKKI